MHVFIPNLQIDQKVFLENKKGVYFYPLSSLFAGKNLDKGILQEQFLSSVVQSAEKN